MREESVLPNKRLKLAAVRSKETVCTLRFSTSAAPIVIHRAVRDALGSARGHYVTFRYA
jgi:hypothetical protein